MTPRTANRRYRHLLAPGRIGRVELRNRIVMPAMDQNACTGEGLITDAVVAHYEDRARGGAGLLILETSAVAYPVGATSRHQPSLSTDDCIPGLRRLADAVHAHDSKMVVQMCHHGRVARIDTIEGRDQIVASAAIPQYRPDLEDITPDELSRIIAVSGGRRPGIRSASQADLDWVVKAFADAARRVQEAGLDGAEIHAGHGYLISSFLSPLYNHREDSYGGSAENRARLLTRVVEAVRAACGPDFAVIVRLDGREYVRGGGSSADISRGIEPDLAATYASLAESAGADAVHVSANSTNSMSAGFTDGPLPWLPGQYVDLARTVKAAVSVPVIAVGRISPDLGEELLSRGDTCDFVSMGRQLLADPDLPVRLMSGRPELVRTCINCFVCVAQNFWDATPICAVNTRLGHYDQPIPPQVAPDAGRRVLVVGGGPAGMEAARVAAGRGHHVVLIEKDRLGGTAWLSGLTTPSNSELVRYLKTAITEAGVDVRLGVEADVAGVLADNPDVVVVATGARRRRPDVTGGDLPHVLSGDDLRQLLSGGGRGSANGVGRGVRFLLKAAARLGVLGNIDRMRRLSRVWMPLGRRMVVIGGGLVGIELAEFLAERGRQVTLLEEGSFVGTEMALPRRLRAVQRLSEAGVRVEREAVVVSIDSKAVLFRQGDREEKVPADQVIYAAGVETDSSLADALAAAGVEAHPVGDCAKVGYIEGAIHSAAAIAAQI
ncbi:MAG TPA: FAD-dependent oxidoreductase [Acidimicrobiales bacterium]|nr:FAD-dependent oxidoreductase [Acidimicrobiales bacterium]